MIEHGHQDRLEVDIAFHSQWSRSSLHPWQDKDFILRNLIGYLRKFTGDLLPKIGSFASAELRKNKTTLNSFDGLCNRCRHQLWIVQSKRSREPIKLSWFSQGSSNRRKIFRWASTDSGPIVCSDFLFRNPGNKFNDKLMARFFEKVSASMVISPVNFLEDFGRSARSHTSSDDRVFDVLKTYSTYYSNLLPRRSFIKASRPQCSPIVSQNVFLFCARLEEGANNSKLASQ